MDVHLSPRQENRVAEALRSGAYKTADDVIDRALEVLREQDEIGEDELDTHLNRLKAQPE